MPALGFVRLLVVVAVGALAGSGCIGSKDQSELEDIVRSRGGGISQQLVIDAIDAVADARHSDSDTLEAVTATNNRVVVEAPIATQPGESAAYTYGTSGLYGGKGLSGPERRVRTVNEDALEEVGFTPRQVALDRLDDMLDEALAQAGLPDAYVESVVIGRPTGGDPVVVTVLVRNDQDSVARVFTADGDSEGVRSS